MLCALPPHGLAQSGLCLRLTRTSCSARSWQQVSPAGISRDFSALTRRRECDLLPATSVRHFGAVSSTSSAAVDSLRGALLSCLDSAPVSAAAGQLCWLHDALGLPWWAAVAGATVALRGALMLPSHVMAQTTIAKRAVLVQTMDKTLIPLLRQKVKDAQVKHGWTPLQARAKFRHYQKLIWKDKVVEYNCAATKMFVPFMLQIPLWISVSMALRRLCFLDQMRREELSAEGLLWLNDLTVPDPTIVLPLLVGSFYLANVFLQANNHMEGIPRSKSAKALTAAFTALALWMSAVATYVPAAMSLYWAVSGATGLAVNLAVMSPKMRNLLKIPLVPGEESTAPYQRVMNNAQIKWDNLLKKASARVSPK